MMAEIRSVGKKVDCTGWIATLMQNVMMYKVSTVTNAIRCETLLPVVCFPKFQLVR